MFSSYCTVKDPALSVLCFVDHNDMKYIYVLNNNRKLVFVVKKNKLKATEQKLKYHKNKVGIFFKAKLIYSINVFCLGFFGFFFSFWRIKH